MSDTKANVQARERRAYGIKQTADLIGVSRSTVNAGLLKQWRPPAGSNLRRVVVFGDNDKTGTGQAAAWELKRRLTVVEKIPEVEVEIYPVPGGDWNDRLAA
jgi:hypothetical protein